MELFCSAKCGPGKVRPENQDNLFVSGIYRGDVDDNSEFQYSTVTSGSALFAVADGMGGEHYGELASLKAVEALRSLGPEPVPSDILRCLQDCNLSICELMREKGGVRIGSTFVSVSFSSNHAQICNIGDSRAYFLRQRKLYQLSKDHTMIRQLVESGAITQDAARSHPDRHRLSQHLGIFPSEMIIEPYLAPPISIMPGDIFLLCSDGLTDMLSDAEIAKQLAAARDPSEAVQSLYASAMQAGGRDNTTVLIVQCE